MAETYFLDVNVPMYAAGSEHNYKPACSEIMNEVVANNVKASIDTEVLQEILHRFGAINRPQEGVRMARNVQTIIPNILSINQPVIETAISLFDHYSSKGVQARDTIHAAVMIETGLTTIISTDQHFDLFEELNRVDPLEWN